MKFLSGDRTGLNVGVEVTVYNGSPDTSTATVVSINSRSIHTDRGLVFNLRTLRTRDGAKRITYWSGRPTA